MGYTTRCMSEMAGSLSRSSFVEASPEFQGPETETKDPLIEAFKTSVEEHGSTFGPDGLQSIGEAAAKPFLDNDKES